MDTGYGDILIFKRVHFDGKAGRSCQKGTKRDSHAVALQELRLMKRSSVTHGKPSEP